MFEDGVPWRDGLKTGVGVWCLGFGIVALLLTILSVLAGQFDPIGILASAIVFFLESRLAAFTQSGDCRSDAGVLPAGPGDVAVLRRLSHRIRVRD